jgi:hypothetical protein
MRLKSGRLGSIFGCMPSRSGLGDPCADFVGNGDQFGHYALTVGGAIYAYRARRMPGHRAGDFSLGRWFIPVAVVAFAYAAAVIVIALAPHEGHTAAIYLLGAEVVGVLWYLLYLRRRIANRSAGVLRQEVIELEESAEASPSVR